MQKKLYTYDDSFIRIHEDYVMDAKSSMKVENYLYGRCHLFAYALAGINNMELGIYYQEGFMNDEGVCRLELLHAFCCYDAEVGIDARGLVWLEEIRAEYDEGCEILFLKGKDAIKALESMKLEGFNTDIGEMDIIARHITQMMRFDVLKPGVLKEDAYEFA